MAATRINQDQVVGIIGSGVAGLQVAANLRKAGIQVIIFEKTGDVGGVWQNNYTGYRLQVQHWHFEIPGYPWPEGTTKPYPAGPEVQAYLQGYAKDAGLLPLIRFNTEVLAISPKGDTGEQGWLVTYKQTLGNGSTQISHKDVRFLVVATGLFNIPARPGWATDAALAASTFKGQVVDARDFSDAEAARDRHVLVIGAGKTAVDVAVALSGVTASTHLVARKGHWWAPQTVLGVVPFEFAAYTRWSWALQPAWYDSSATLKLAHAVLSPVKAAVWKLLGWLFPLHTGIPSELAMLTKADGRPELNALLLGLLIPAHGLLEGIYDTIGIVAHADVAKAFKTGAIKAHKAEVVELSDNAARLDNDLSLEADLIILATGYTTAEHQLLDAKHKAAAGYDTGGVHWLYRNLLPLDLHNLAFVGLNATFQHVLTTALQARWLTAAITGELKLPSWEHQAADVAAQKAWVKSRAFPFPRNNNFVWAQHGKFHDQLLRDLKQPTSRKGWNIVAEWFGYIRNDDFAGLFPGNVEAAQVAQGSCIKQL